MTGARPSRSERPGKTTGRSEAGAGSGKKEVKDSAGQKEGARNVEEKLVAFAKFREHPFREAQIRYLRNRSEGGA